LRHLATIRTLLARALAEVMRGWKVGIERRATRRPLLWLAIAAVGCTVDVGGTQVAAFGTPCASSADCTALTGECLRPACLPEGVCGTAPDPAGTVAVGQTPGDCLVNVCDGNGGVTSEPDDADVADDGNGCTEDTCAAGSPLFTNRPAGASCAEGSAASCDGSGQCSGAAPATR
jgi:hypothetical protein